MKYLDQINGKYLDISSKYNTGNGYLDMIFSSVFSKHQNLNITIVSPIPSTDDIIMIDFATLLYNLLENACDAAELTELKLVKVKIVSTESQYLILVENSSLINPIITDFSTTKASGSHGYGIEIIRDIVKKYKGKIYNDYANFIFITRISIEK